MICVRPAKKGIEAGQLRSPFLATAFATQLDKMGRYRAAQKRIGSGKNLN